MRKCAPVLFALTLAAWSAGTVHAQSVLIPDAELDRLGLQRYWQASPPLPTGELVKQHALVDDNVYLISETNLAVAVHAGTGVVRWVAQVAGFDQNVLAPTHSDAYAFFTGPASVKVLNRRTGELAGEPRRLRGVIVTVNQDVARISIGAAHGVRLDDVLDIFNVNDSENTTREPTAQLRITVVDHKESRGRLVRESRTQKVNPGDRVRQDVRLPLREVKLPFAASSPAVADDEDLFVGAANQRMYSLRFLSGFTNWRVLTPKNMAAAPTLFGDSVYFCDNDGRCASATKRKRRRNWEFFTDGAITISPVVTEESVFVASSDRSLYCLNRETGRRNWTQRFDNVPDLEPIISGDRIFLRTRGNNVHALRLEDGSELWKREGVGRFMMQLEDDAYLWSDSPAQLTRVNIETGETEASVGLPMVNFADANAADQLIVFGRSDGTLLCARPNKAPHLRPEQLALVLQNDQKAKEIDRYMAEKEAERLRLAAARKEADKTREKASYSFLEDDDFLTSRSAAVTAVPSKVAQKAAPKATTPATEKPAEKSTEKPEEDPWGGDGWGETDSGDDKKDDGEKDKDKEKDKDGDGDKDKDDDDDDGWDW